MLVGFAVDPELDYTGLEKAGKYTLDEILVHHRTPF